jgi:hypothetical protein
MQEPNLFSLPIDPDILLFLKFFVVVTCVFFWIRLGYLWLFRQYLRPRHRHEHYD